MTAQTLMRQRLHELRKAAIEVHDMCLSKNLACHTCPMPGGEVFGTSLCAVIRHLSRMEVE